MQSAISAVRELSTVMEKIRETTVEQVMQAGFLEEVSALQVGMEPTVANPKEWHSSRRAQQAQRPCCGRECVAFSCHVIHRFRTSLASPSLPGPGPGPGPTAGQEPPCACLWIPPPACQGPLPTAVWDQPSVLEPRDPTVRGRQHHVPQSHLQKLDVKATL